MHFRRPGIACWHSCKSFRAVSEHVDHFYCVRFYGTALFQQLCSFCTLQNAWLLWLKLICFGPFCKWLGVGWWSRTWCSFCLGIYMKCIGFRLRNFILLLYLCRMCLASQWIWALRIESFHNQPPLHKPFYALFALRIWRFLASMSQIFCYQHGYSEHIWQFE